MELSDARVLESLLSDCEKRTLRKPSRARMPVVSVETVYQAPATKSTVRRCQCGACAQCRENARWERIFETKFADPDYYTRPLRVSQGSPLAEG